MKLTQVMEEIISKERAQKQDLDAILDQRNGSYGIFSEQALVSQNIKSALRHSPNWKKLPEDMKESLELIATKLGRILNGDPNHEDSWVDIAGYAQLVVDRLRGDFR